jgi:hypothetical protein
MEHPTTGWMYLILLILKAKDSFVNTNSTCSSSLLLVHIIAGRLCQPESLST